LCDNYASFETFCKMDEKIVEKYTDFKNPGSFQSVTGFVKNNKKISVASAEKALGGTEAYTLHKPLKKKFSRNQFVVNGIDDQWQIDLADVKKIADKHYCQWFFYLFVCIDVFSKYAWVIPIKEKSSKNCTDALKEIFSKTTRRPRRVYSDQGTEFMGEFRSFLKTNKIQQIFTNSDLLSKAAIAERFIRTLKERLYRVFSFRKNTKYSDILQDVIDSYNKSYHRSIKTTPDSNGL